MDEVIEQPNGRCVGIDLGTTNSVVAYIDEAGQPQVIPSQEGPRTVPSVFAVAENGEFHIGLAAVNQEGENAKNTVRSIKSKMGTSDRVTLSGKEWSPEEVSAEILKKLKRDAELFLGEPVTSAVITVPAYFNSDQRQATKTAGQLAGLEVLRIISEPTAAALAYGLDRKKAETVLVYDLGGGTFDVTVLKITGGGIFDVQSTSGDTRLGGDDFDKKLMGRILRDAPFNYSDTSMQLVYSPFMTVKTDVPFVFIDEAMKARLREAAENCKKQLSASNSADVYIPYFAFADGRPINVRTTITREEFEDMIKPELDRTRNCIERALKDARIEPTELSEVVFVGGSTRVPAVAARVEEWTGIKPNRRIHPDEAVAIGAAVQAGALTQGIGILVLDVTPLSLGIETQGGAMAVMVPRNTTIPTDDVTELFTTAEDNQESVDVKVYQGERPLVRNNVLIGNFRLSGITPAPRGAAEIEVTFRVDTDGIVNVSARDRATNRTHTVTIEGRSSLSDDDIRRMLEDAEANREADEKLRSLQKLHNALANQLLQVEALLRDCSGSLTEEQVKDLNDLRGSLTDAAQFDKIDVLGAIAQSADETLKAVGRALKVRAQQRLDEAADDKE